MMKFVHGCFFFLVVVCSVTVSAQKKEKLKGNRLEANQYVFEGNQILTGEEPDVLESEKNYRRAIAKDANNSKARYNLGVSHYATKNYQEAASRFNEAAKLAHTEAERAAAYHNEGNALMALQKTDDAIKAYKNALRNNPLDSEARKNLAVAKKIKEQQDKNKSQQNQDQNKNQNQNKDDNKKEDKNQKDPDNKKDGDKDDKNGELDDSEKDKDGDKEDEKENDKPEDEKNGEEDQKDGNDDKDGENQDDNKQRQVKEGQLSPDQVKSLLEAMSDEEKKVQDKLNAKKVKGARVKTDKDW